MIEFLLEVLFEIVVNAVFERGGKRFPGARVARWLAIGALLAVAVVGGAVWGRYASGQLDGGLPRSIWISLATGVVALVVAIGLHRSGDDHFAGTPGDRPRRWPQRLASLGTLNLVTAGAIAWGAATV